MIPKEEFEAIKVLTKHLDLYPELILADIHNDSGASIEQIAELTKYLLSKHFDLFNLIESGESLDAATLTPSPYL